MRGSVRRIDDAVDSRRRAGAVVIGAGGRRSRGRRGGIEGRSDGIIVLPTGSLRRLRLLGLGVRRRVSLRRIRRRGGAASVGESRRLRRRRVRMGMGSGRQRIMLLLRLMIGRHGRAGQIVGGLGAPGGSSPWSGSGRAAGGRDLRGLQLGLLTRGRRHGRVGCGLFPGATIPRLRFLFLLGGLAVRIGVGGVLVGLQLLLVLLAARPTRTARRAAGVRLLVGRRIANSVRMHGRERVAFLWLPDTCRRIVGHSQRMRS